MKPADQSDKLRAHEDISALALTIFPQTSSRKIAEKLTFYCESFQIARRTAKVAEIYFGLEAGPLKCTLGQNIDILPRNFLQEHAIIQMQRSGYFARTLHRRA